jgi:threonyl-tRNA synthetase
MMDQGEIEGYLLKPMNCPHHIKIFDSQQHSYRDLPVRLAEFGTVYRWEQSGELSGMTRVRGFTQDDAHLFCTPEQVDEEILGCIKIVQIIFSKLGMEDYRVRVGLRDPDSSKYVGDPERWDRAEAACRRAAEQLGVPFSEEPGEAAFYGPKIDFVVKDVLGRDWQLGTVQVDYVLPERFDLSYIGPDGQAHRPVMIHRAPFGSMERFVGVLIEHFGGAFPTWLAPLQVMVVSVAEAFGDYADEVVSRLKALGVRASHDDSSDTMGKKVRRAITSKIPNVLVVGEREANERAVTLRCYGSRAQHEMSLEEFEQRIEKAIREREPSLVDPPQA